MIRISDPVVAKLQARGMLPKYCASVELHIRPHDAMVLRYEVLVADTHLRALGEAFLEMAATKKMKAAR